MCKFEELNKLNVNDKVEKKKTGNTELSYLSWAWAWAEFKKVYPEAQYKIRNFKKDNSDAVVPYMYDNNTGYMVQTEVTADGLTYEMWLPVMDGSNKAMKDKPYEVTTSKGFKKTVEQATMFDINKTIMRCLVKNLAMFGLGLYIYAGEDLPDGEEKSTDNYSNTINKVVNQTRYSEEEIETPICPICGEPTSKGALANWGMCAKCKQKGGKND